jgi:methyl-accepting chemotaxis protein
MNDGSISPRGLRDEWSLLLHSFLDEQSDSSQTLNKLNQSGMSIDQIKSVKKDLSSRRKKMNQAIEKIKIKIDQMNSVIENLELVGSDVSNLQKEISSLSTEGEHISEQIMAVDAKIKKLHELQDQVLAATAAL